jgi:uncharacterized damage-inducible protein DinB
MPDHLLPLPSGFDPTRQATVGTLAAGLDDQLRRLEAALAGLSVEALEWQAAPGMNSIGMLAAHLALVEVWWIRFAPAGKGPFAALDGEFRALLGIGGQDDGIDVGGRTAFPDALRGWTAPRYVEVLRKARAVVNETLRGWSDEDLATVVTGARGSVTWRWILYHVLEHFAGHFGQVLLVKHQLRDAGLLAAT